MLTFLKLIGFTLLFLLSNLACAHSLHPAKFIVLADIHFDPFIGCNQLPSPCPIVTELRATSPQVWDTIFQKHLPKIQTNYHQDTDYQLLKSTLTELTTLTQQQNPTFTLILGDFLAHKFPKQYKKYSSDHSTTGYQTFVKKTLQYVTYKLNKASPTTNIYPVIGNNDSYGDNYEVVPNGTFLQDTGNTFTTLIKNKSNQEQFHHEFPISGYYAVTLAKKNQRLIVLDSVLFSRMHLSHAMQNAATDQLLWLKTQLANAAQQNQKVLLALHIPAGIDVFLGIKLRFNLLRDFWHPLFWQTAYNEKFVALLKQYPTTIIGILPGHIHADAFQLITDKQTNTDIPISFTPAISPIYGNNPGFKVFSYDNQTFQLTDFDTYYYPINQRPAASWQKEYNFNTVYQPDCKQCSLVTGMRQLTVDGNLANSFIKYYSVSRKAQPIATQNAWAPYYWCGIYHPDWETYKACL